MRYLYIFGTIIFTVYGQLIIKLRINRIDKIPKEIPDKIIFFIKLVFDPLILSGLLSAFIAALFWIATLAKFDLSYAYPFMSLSFVIVFVLAVIFFHEPITIYKIVGLFVICIGIIIISR
ncbi:MAG: EamA family transporter [Candidatus Lokiarchaeota archaeon]|nr:EamA family transporter [Candidatus Lokiarchaeota archaeon]